MNYTPLPPLKNHEGISLMKKMIIVFFFILMAALGITFALAWTNSRSSSPRVIQPSSSLPTGRQVQPTSSPSLEPSPEPTTLIPELQCEPGFVKVCEAGACECLAQ